jgi:hypothetical protein
MQRRAVIAILAVSTIVIVIFAGVAGLLIGRGLFAGFKPVIAATPTLVKQVQGLNRLVTVRYLLEKVVLLQDVKWYGENRVLMVAHGIANAGIDLDKVTADDISADGKSITIRIPKPRLFDVYLDERHTQIVERSTGMLREFDKDLEQDARRQALDQIRVAARDSGILKDAEDRARLQLEALFRGAGFETVTVTIR